MVSASLGKPVWELLDVPEFYLDLQLTLDSKYPKGSLKYTNKQMKDELLAGIEPKVAWSNRLSGKALQRFLAGQLKGLKYQGVPGR